MDSDKLKEMSKDAAEQAEPYSSEVFYEQLMQVYNRVIEESEDSYMLAKAKGKSDSIEVTLKRGLEKEVVLDVSLDDFYEYGLKKGRVVAPGTVEILKRHQEENKAYRRCLTKLSIRDRSVKEMQDWLKANTECDSEQIEEIIDRLVRNAYLDDRSYCEAEVLRMKSALYGEDKIRRSLERKGIGTEIADEVLQRHIDGRAFLNRQRDSHNTRPVGVQRGPRIIAVLEQRSRFEVEADHGRILKIIFNAAHIGYTFVFHR
jgi:1,2-diacylglycerol 3-alpha-glucosyltransferase